MNKILPLLTALVVASPATAETVKATIQDYYTTEYVYDSYTKEECQVVDVPVYGTRLKEGNAAEGALLGMILGGLIGKGATGDDGGAAAGAVMGGIIGADKGGKPSRQQEIVGYKKERVCKDVVYTDTIPKKVYDYSILDFTSNGIQYRIPFER